MTKTYIVTGPCRLEGSIPIGGAKNSALKMMAAALLVPGKVRIARAPAITDVDLMVEVLDHLGATASFEDGVVTVDASGELLEETPYELVTKMRASIQVLGPLLARLGRARVAMPGGDAIGSRPIDLHLEGLERMGAKFSVEHGYVEGIAGELRGASILLDFPSVGATETILMAAVTAKGTTIIENAAREPEIQDLASFLQACGANIEGAGTPSVIIEGVDSLAPVDHAVISDRIEAGTYAIAAAATQGDVTLQNIDHRHLELPLQKLEKLGAEVTRGDGQVRVAMRRRADSIDLVTLPYPGFPTDLQPLMMVLLAKASGSSILTENVFESRFLFIDELNRMGCKIRVEGHHAVIRGIDELSGAPVRAPDIRAAAALVLGGLCAGGRTEIYDTGHIERGYEHFEEKLRSLGAALEVAES